MLVKYNGVRVKKQLLVSMFMYMVSLENTCHKLFGLTPEQRHGDKQGDGVVVTVVVVVVIARRAGTK